MKLRWIILLLVVVGGGAAASWALGLWGESAPPPERAAPQTAKPAPPPNQPAPLDTAAWMLAHSHPAAALGTPPARTDDDSACGPSGAPCLEDTVCVAGACLATLCEVDGGAGRACARPHGQAGTCCSDRCIDLATDGSSCGKCGIVCDPGLDCLAGRCEARSCTGRMSGTSCLTDQGSGDCCRGQCVDRSAWVRDASNCGGCGHACAPGLACQQGACVDPATGQLPAWSCFERGHGCPADSFCVIDACYPRSCGAGSDGQMCPGTVDGQIGHCCDGACRDLFTDTDNCRACGLRCNPGESCKGGDCVK